ncbi:MAG: DUF4342 domain-containing protein [Armatimonadetes bacterium]|nr:DUF4342 domain-containing protein [Anaerolineae bacterium]
MAEQTPDNKNTVSEEMELMGGQVLERVQDLIKEGNVRRVIIRDANNTVLIDTTLTVSALAGGALALIAGPFLLALTAIAAVVGKVKVEVVREITDIDVAKSKMRVQISNEE